MERCILCGGKLRAGRCAECGLDNTKNDKKYRLNVHNEKTIHFHRGKCEDNLNQTSTYSHGWDVEIPDKRSGKKEYVFEKYSKKTASSKSLKKRRETGTVRKNNSVKKLVRWIVLAVLLIEFLPSLVLMIRETVEDGFREYTYEWNSTDEDPVFEEEGRPEEILWNKDADTYFEEKMQPGMYLVGRDLPSGRYQLYCESGTAWVSWKDADEEYSDYAYLYSQEEQEKEIEQYYYELSQEITLDDGDMFCVENCRSLWLKGEASGELVPPESQGLSAIGAGEDMWAGEDFEPGIYDICLKEDVPEGTYVSASVEIEKEDGSSYYLVLDPESPGFFRFDFEEGDHLQMRTYGDLAEVKLYPSF